MPVDISYCSLAMFTTRIKKNKEQQFILWQGLVCKRLVIQLKKSKCR